MKRKAAHKPVHVSPLALSGLALAVGSVGFLAYGQMQLQSQMTQVGDGLEAVASAIESSQSRSVDSEGLAGAVERVMAERQQREREEAKAELMSDYTNLPTDVDGQWTYGNTDARYTLYTYSDPNCPHCQNFHDTPKQLVDSSKGILNAQYHHMAIMAANSTTQAIASECAGRLGDNQYFWAVNDSIYENPQLQRGGLIDLAETLGFERKAFSECMNSADMRDYVSAMGKEANDKGVTGTPTSFLIDNQTGEEVRLSGAQPAGAIVAALRELIQKQSPAGGADTEGGA